MMWIEGGWLVDGVDGGWMEQMVGEWNGWWVHDG